MAKRAKVYRHTRNGRATKWPRRSCRCGIGLHDRNDTMCKICRRLYMRAYMRMRYVKVADRQQEVPQ